MGVQKRAPKNWEVWSLFLSSRCTCSKTREYYKVIKRVCPGVCKTPRRVVFCYFDSKAQDSHVRCQLKTWPLAVSWSEGACPSAPYIQEELRSCPGWGCLSHQDSDNQSLFVSSDFVSIFPLFFFFCHCTSEFFLMF